MAKILIDGHTIGRKGAGNERYVMGLLEGLSRIETSHDIICYVPVKTPYSCIADGLIIGSGNTMGWLDIRLAEVMSIDLIHVDIRRKDGTGHVLVFRPRRDLLEHIDAPKPQDLEKLSRECSTMQESDLFRIERLIQGNNRKRD